MNNEQLCKAKNNYIAIIKQRLIGNGYTAYAADSAIEKYELRRRLDLFPDEQLHDGIQTTISNMIKCGALSIA